MGLLAYNDPRRFNDRFLLTNVGFTLQADQHHLSFISHQAGTATTILVPQALFPNHQCTIRPFATTTINPTGFATTQWIDIDGIGTVAATRVIERGSTWLIITDGDTFTGIQTTAAAEIGMSSKLSNSIGININTAILTNINLQNTVYHRLTDSLTLDPVGFFRVAIAGTYRVGVQCEVTSAGALILSPAIAAGRAGDNWFMGNVYLRNIAPGLNQGYASGTTVQELNVNDVIRYRSIRNTGDVDPVDAAIGGLELTVTRLR